MSMSVTSAAFFRRVLLAVVLAGIAAPAPAQVHKCKSSDGSVIYQEAPCGSATGILSAPAQPAGAAVGGGKTKPADTTSKAMNDAFQSRMDKRDYEGAQAFATTNQQKELARKKAAEKDLKCESLSTKARQATADFNTKGERYRSKADAAEAEYRTHCR